MVNWNPYLDSLCNAYTQWWKFGTLKDVVEPKRVESEPSTLPFEFGLMVQTVERETQQKSKEEQKVERLGVLEGLQKYASEHVLLVGRPGGGKSTALVRLLVATAKQALQNPHSQIPVLVELRTYKIYYKTSVLDLVQASLKRHKLRRLDIETIEDLLAQGRFLLLMDGINELPDDEARRNIKEFRLDYSDVPMVFTTRDLGVGGDLGIEKKLEMQSLTEAEVEKFVDECMPGGSKERLQQLRQRLRELGQTPFVMWMLYFIVQKTEKETEKVLAGSAFQEFTQLYERCSKDDAPVSDKSRRWWPDLLKHLAFEMMQADKPTDFRLTISKQEAEDILTKFLDSEKISEPRDCVRQYLGDLLKHHLIQVTSHDQIEFCHQLIQEYYAAEILLQMLLQKPSPLNDETLKREYLNYLKWTEPLALMLELVEDETLAVQVVKLALKVDLRLGARLAGAVKPKFQEKTIDLVTIQEISQQLKMLLLGITHSHIAINILFQALEDRDYSVRWFTTEALGQIVSEATIPGLRRAIQDEDNEVRWAAFNALEKIGTEAIIPPLIQASKDENTMICEQAIYLLGDIAGEAAIPYLIEALAKEDNSVRGSALCILGQICGKNTIPELIQDLEDRGFDVHSSAFSVIRRWRGIAFFTRPSITYCRLGYSNTISSYAKRMCQKDTIPVLCQKLADEDPDVRKTAVYMLGQIGTDEAIHALCQALDNKDPIVCRDAVHWLGQVHRETGTKTVFPCLLQALEHEDSDVRGYASYVLEQMGIPELLPNLFEMELTAANNIYGILETISAIQGRCKYYNQVIATSPPPQEENNAKPLTVPLDMQEYEDILAVIFNMALVMERCPEAFRRMDEEALRQHFLVQLNGKYKGQSAGEIFNKKGKTDILIRVDGKNIFIAECKFWRGKNNLKETLDQLLGYTTWRDTKLALLIFNRNKNFSAVLEQISEVMKNHPTFTQELSYPSETGFRFILHHPEDKNRELLLTVLAFEIPRSH